MRIAWRSVSGIVAWRHRGPGGPVGQVMRIGIDEISHRRKDHRYLLVVVDHDTGRLVWAGKGADQASRSWFFALRGPATARQSATSLPTRPDG